ncbi:MAG: alpha/beta hydrolase [SAR324 cluster bacterium]|jgi:pimeloyl-ACP methyl ester carboxylesterase|nr:alpha/beta hydrolase [SAR324 cluster bacterium]
MKPKTLEGMIYILLIYVLVGAVLFFYQRKLIYFPTANIPHNYEQLQLTHENVTLEIIVLNQGKKEAILYFGGNAEAVVYSAEDFLSAFPLQTVYLLNYRGYGGSSGQPSEAGIFADALFLFDKVLDKQAIISVIGRSLGSGVATYLASKRPVEKMALISPFDSITSVAQNIYMIFPVFLMLLDKYDSISRVKEIEAKTIILVAEHDEVIPRKHSQRLIDEFPPEQISVKIIADSGHNDISNKVEYYQHLKDFFND